ncbi:hypothetical protein G6F46_015174 [Rhizopus delemar]|uniref:Uncharacterized protein n=1 Tax=Rhizopus delemar (strain RA 99-880 / ATCC MYA-4621 / FGSC 9543 / NRRL 43880) TaxID=246409 RepID=I1CIG4_RHIO9|nr:hypothetical protein RO3G_12955 [Rhizopus delemar RA 99-880]KAG1480701.1 hypothetical protein G6F54_013799 [Rhizopus delemar]KAG1483605.1 hypothetical protein G6F53_014052 [Rhizopus delemar]KAG1582933.1 hypothetical protein G6F46_015174 [Rhizopus delemar]|eukprot:EIE88244.1 hypothetical protein RO3G_12955 [Rhizopus delemar RA 99-880]
MRPILTATVCRTSRADPTSATSSAYNRLLMGVGDGDEEDKAAAPTKGPKGRQSGTRAPGPGGPEHQDQEDQRETPRTPRWLLQKQQNEAKPAMC